MTGVLVAALTSHAAPKGATAPPLTQLGGSDPAEGRAALEQVRQQGIAGNYFLEFQLRVMPRRGAERTIPGRLWGAHNQMGPVARVSLNLPAAKSGTTERRLLIQNGRNSSVWRWDTGGTVQMLGATSPFDPLVPDCDLSAFDLQMPFLFWDDFEYKGLVRFRGRPAHMLIMKPPAAFATKYPKVTGVRVQLDTQYNALVQTEVLGAGNAVLKTLSLVDLKKVGEQWIPKTLDVRDETTRNKTRFDVVAVALDVEFARNVFEPVQLAEETRAPDSARLERIGP
ncbi:MAG: outer membrane lipoprotein-sorting protein [Opitutus sp.]